MIKAKNDVKNIYEDKVYLCEQNRSSSSLKGSFKKRHPSSKIVDSSLDNRKSSHKKTSSLEKMTLNAHHLNTLSPSKSLLYSQNLSPWCSLKDLNVISNSNLSINNNYDATSRDCLGSITNLDTVSLRISSNSINSLQFDSLDLNDISQKLPPLESLSNVQLPFAKQNFVVNSKQPQLLQLHATNKTVAKFSRSTSCPQVIPIMQLKHNQKSPHFNKRFDCKYQTERNISPAPPENVKTPVNTEAKIFFEDISLNESEAKDKKEISKSGEARKKSMMASKSLARSKCMQWLNSLDEGD